MSNFSIYWTVDNVEHTKQIASRINVKKPVLFPRYQGSLSGLEASSAYVGSKEIDPVSSLRMINLEDSISENSRQAFVGESQFRGKSFSTSGRYFLLTDIVGDFVSSVPAPFYWKHVLPSGDIIPDSVSILDKNLNDVEDNSFRVVRTEARDSSDQIVSGTYESCAVFSNYRNTFNAETGESDIYYVRYEVSGSNHYELLNNEPAFSEATADDISSVTGQLKTWRKVYIISPGVIYYSITTPHSSTDYFLKSLDRSRIQVSSPVDDGDDAPWFVNISNGGFTTILDGNSYSYSVPEFSSQTFSPLEPYKVEVNEKATLISPDLLKLGHTPLKVDSSMFSMEVLIQDVDGNTVYALTTDTSKASETYLEGGERIFRSLSEDAEWVEWDTEGIVGWDSEGGFVHLLRDYSNSYLFKVSYYYKELGYEFTNLNLNPVFDEDYSGQYYVLYCIPTGGRNANLGSQNSSIHYVKVNRSGQIIDTSQIGLSGNIPLNQYIRVDGEYCHYSRTNSSTVDVAGSAGATSISVDKATLSRNSSGAIDLPPRGVLLIGDGINGETLSEDSSFPVGYSSWASVGSSVVFTLSGTLDDLVIVGDAVSLLSFKDTFSSDGSNKFRWLVLSQISVTLPTSIEDLSILDVRQTGGIIKDKYFSEAKAIDPRTIWTKPEYIVSRGQPTPGNTVAVMKIPYTLLIEYGGSFTRPEIEDVVAKRHLALGTFPAIIYHGAIPEIDSIASTSTTATITWTSEGEDYSYNIYYSSLPEGPWTLANSTPLVDQSYGNTHTISGLTPGLIYYIKVASVDLDGIVGPKSVAWGIRTRIS